MNGLPGSLLDFGPAALAAVVVAGYLVVGEPVAGHVLHRRFEGRLRSDPGARRSFYLRLLILEWGLALLALVIWLSAPGVDAGEVGLRWPQQWPGPVTGPGHCWGQRRPTCAASTPGAASQTTRASRASPHSRMSSRR